MPLVFYIFWIRMIPKAEASSWISEIAQYSSDITQYHEIAGRLLQTSAGLQAGECVTILGRADSLAFCEALELECRRLGAAPLVIVGSDAVLLAALADPGVSEASLALASPALVAALAASDL